jgi:hypothetical protein
MSYYFNSDSYTGRRAMKIMSLRRVGEVVFSYTYAPSASRKIAG